MSNFFKSILYLSTFGGFGWVLMKVTEPSPEKIKKLQEKSGTLYGDDLRRNQLIVQRLKEAADPNSRSISGSGSIKPKEP